MVDQGRDHLEEASGLGNRPDLSLVIPIFNEAENLRLLCDEIERGLAGEPWNYEILWVDDGSTDGGGQILEDLCREVECAQTLQLAQNSGQSVALIMGFRAAKAPIVVTLDADLQNDPADIPQVVRALDGYDLVSGIRAVRQDSWIRRISSRLANATRRFFLGDSIIDVGCSLKAYRREWLRELPALDGLHRFLPCVLEAQGARIRQLNVGHRPRLHGESKYGVHNRLWRGLYDLVGVRWLVKRWLAKLPRQGHFK